MPNCNIFCKWQKNGRDLLGFKKPAGYVPKGRYFHLSIVLSLWNFVADQSMRYFWVLIILFCYVEMSAQVPDSTILRRETVELTDSIAETRTAKPSTELNPEPETQNFEPETLNFKPETPDLIHLSDSTDLADIFPLEDLDSYSKHSPAKAAMMSAVLPGLGQIYNRKYWKVPIVYVAVGVSAYIFITWQNEFERTRKAYIDLMDKDPYTNYFEIYGFPSFYTQDQMVQYVTKRKDILRTWRDWSIVAVVMTYALNIIDANVDAHLMDYNLDDNISLNIRPCFLENSFNSKIIGLTLQFSF